MSRTLLNKQIQLTRDMNIVFTLKATVIVPPKEKPCTQWITFNTEDEPVLNNALVTDKGCDNFLKRLQRTKLFPDQDTGTSIPMGQQFCFEPVTDKRYNRWKRRRRKKKETDFRRSTMTLQCDSSDEDSNEREMERIIGHMYEEIHGPAPATPNGTSDTPRMRNRRRRRQLASRSETKLTDNDPDSLDLHYDASSEWMTSDKSDDEIAIDICKNGRRKSSHRIERNAYSAGCERRPLSSTMMEVRSAQQATKYHSLQAPIHQPFDPSVIDKRPIRSAVAEVRNVHQAHIQQSVQTAMHLSADQTVKESYPPADECRPETPLKEDFRPDKNVDDMCTWPYLDQYREQIMERVKCNPTDDVMNRDWLPEIPNPVSPIGSGQVKHNYEAGSSTDTDSEVKAVEPDQRPSGPTLLKDPVIKVRGRSNSNSSDSHAKTKFKPKGILPLNLPSCSLKDSRDSKSSSSKDYKDSKFARKSRQFTKPKETEQAPKSISRSSASNWSELGVNPKQPKPIGVVSVGGCTDTGLQVSTSSFKASLRPVRPNETLSSQKLAIKTDLKYNKAPKKKEFSLPKLNKPTVRAQPNIRRRNSFLNTDRKVKKAIKPEIVRTERLQTMPLHDGARKIPKSDNLDPQTEFLFRDFYLRRLYGKKMRLNSHMQSIKRSTPVKQTLAVEILDNVKKPVARTSQEKERSVSNLSFTRAFTFSMFDLPDVHKMYNKRLERNAELSDNVGSLLSVHKAVTRA